MDLRTHYLGLELRNPLVAGASPLTRELDDARRLEDAGVSALVMYSLFQEQIEHDATMHDHYLDYGAESYAEAVDYVPMHVGFRRGPNEYVDHLERLKQAVDIPVIASLNAASEGGWVDYANKMQSAGADALELNIYYVAADPDMRAEQVEQRYIDIVTAVREAVTIPLAVKIGPYFSALANFARRLEFAGANGLVLFNRFYQPDIELETLSVQYNLHFSARHEMRLPLRWIAVLDAQLDVSLAASTGVYTAYDALKMMMAGADVVQLVAAILRGGPQVVGSIRDGMVQWMEEHEYESIEQMQGSMNQARCPDPVAFERGNYMRQLTDFQPTV